MASEATVGRAALLLKVAVAQGGWSCHYCSVGLAPELVTVDHVVPRSVWLVPRPRRGSWRDYVLACEACNTAKGNAWPLCSCEVCMGAVARWLHAHAAFRRGWLEDGIDGRPAGGRRVSAPPPAAVVPASRPVAL
jgi:hypothetical protein